MKKTLFILILLCGFMFVTNPTKSQFEDYYSVKIERLIEKENTKESNPFKKFGSIFSNKSKQLSALSTLERKDYFIFSTYSVSIFGTQEHYLGAFKFFIRISKSMEKQIEESSKDLEKELEKLDKKIKKKLN